MHDPVLPEGARRALDVIREADIVIGIPSYNNMRTIGHVVRAAQAGVAKYFPQFNAVIVNSDGGSSDGTREAVLSASVDYSRLLIVSTPMTGVHRLSFPYHGTPGKGSAFRLVFNMARLLRAKACAVVDADLRSITPEWIDLLIRPVLHAEYDFVAPYYHRHKYDGTITNSIVYPLTRALYGRRIRQPIGGDFGLSGRIIEHYLSRRDWEADVARYGIDIWMTTIAVAENFKTCQSFLGAKLHDAKDPGADLSAMLQQVVGSVFSLMCEYEHRWANVQGSSPVDLYGFPYEVGLDPIDVNVGRMLAVFHAGYRDLGEIWSMALEPATLKWLKGVVENTKTERDFHLGDELWIQIVYDFARAYDRHSAGAGPPVTLPDPALSGTGRLLRHRNEGYVRRRGGGPCREALHKFRDIQAVPACPVAARRYSGGTRGIWLRTNAKPRAHGQIGGAIMIQVLQQIFEKTLARLSQHLITYIPPSIVALTIVAVAFLLANVLRWIILRLVKGATLDKFLRDTGLSSMVDRSGRLRGASIVAATCYWAILVIGFLTAIDVFDTTLTSRIVETTVFAVPKLITAAAILLAGFWLAQYLSRGTLIWAVNEGIPIARRLAIAVRIIVNFVTIIVAADALDFASRVFYTAFVILIGAAALALSIAAGFSLRGSFEQYFSKRREEEDEHEERSLWHHL